MQTYVKLFYQKFMIKMYTTDLGLSNFVINFFPISISFIKGVLLVFLLSGHGMAKNTTRGSENNPGIRSLEIYFVPLANNIYFCDDVIKPLTYISP